MKRIIFLVAALLTVFSGIAAVTAYEGHQVDVKAHVENALMVNTAEVDFGTTFPEEVIEAQFYVGLSESFRTQLGYSSVQYKMYWEPKSTIGHTVGIDDIGNDGFFIPIWPHIAVQNDGVDFPRTAYVNKGNGIMEIGAGDLNKSDTCDTIHFLFTPPVFQGWYNAATDALNGNPVPVVLGPDYFYTTVETFACLTVDQGVIPGVAVPKTDLGSNFKIQVVNIVGEGNFNHPQ
jgi:hypothetical protein